MRVFLKIEKTLYVLGILIALFLLYAPANTYADHGKDSGGTTIPCNETSSAVCFENEADAWNHAYSPLNGKLTEGSVVFEYNKIEIENLKPGDPIFAMWRFNATHCLEDEKNMCVFRTFPHNADDGTDGAPKELLPLNLRNQSVTTGFLIEITGITSVSNTPPFDGGDQISVVADDTTTITIRFRTDTLSQYNEIPESTRNTWRTLFGINEQTPTETLTDEEFCEKYEPYIPKDLKSLLEQPLSLQVSGYPSFGGESLDTIAERDSLSLSGIVAHLYRSSLVIAGIIAFLSLLYAGILFILSGDSPDNRRSAISRVQKVFFGSFILLTVVLIFEFIGLDINATRNLELGVEIEGGRIVLPSDNSNIVLIRDKENHDYYGIPFTNRNGADRFYGALVAQEVSRECTKCNYIRSTKEGHTKEFACNFACDSTALLSEKAYDIGEFAGYDRMKNYLHAIKTCGDVKNRSLYSDIKEDIQYALVRDDDDTPASCAAACIALADDKGGQCEDYFQENGDNNPGDINKKFRKWIGDKSDDYTGAPLDETLYPNFFMFGRSNSMSDDYLQDKHEKERADLRECIGENYVIDAQQFPELESRTNSTDICVCKKP